MSRSAGLVPEDVLTLPIVGAPAISPDATKAAYAVSTMKRDDDEYAGSLRVVGLADGAIRIYTRGTARDQQPRFSPDGSRLLFISDRGERRQAWFVDLDGGEPYPGPSLPGDVATATFSPDGRRIAAIVTSDERRREIGRRGWRRIERIRYRADGAGYLDDPPRLWIASADDAESARAVTDGSGNVGPAAWSPDGRTLAFAAEHRREADSLYHTELWTVDVAADAQPKRILALRGAIECPVWSPDGMHIAFVGHDDPAYSLGSLKLYVVARDGSGLRCLTGDPRWFCGNAILNDVDVAGTAIAPAFTGDEALVTIATFNGSAGLHRIAFDGTTKLLTPPDHGVTDFAHGRDRIVCSASSTDAPPELFVVGTDGAGWRQLTHETEGWRAGKPLKKARKFQARGNAGDVDVWRLDADGDGERPAILEIHGGPHAAYGETFFFEFQLLAASGYDVVFANPRGSQSYGDAWNRGLVGDWAAPAFDDCMTALDAAIAHGGIDAERLGVAGGSYGGYLTLWTIAHDPRFAAAVAMRAATNLASLWGTSEVGRMLEAELGGRPIDQPERYRRQSPLTYADDIATPLLLIHAQNDFRCPIEQSEQVFAALAERGAPVEFLRFVEGDHGLSRNGPPKLRVGRLHAVKEWFDRYLGG